MRGGSSLVGVRLSTKEKRSQMTAKATPLRLWTALLAAERT
jgi:hypothetical protein